MKSASILEPGEVEVDANTFLQSVFDIDSLPKNEVICVARSYKKNNRMSFDNKPLSQALVNTAVSSNDPFYYCVSTVNRQTDDEPYLKRTRNHARCAYLIGLDDIGTKAQLGNRNPVCC